MTITSPIYRWAVDRSAVLYIELVDLSTATCSSYTQYLSTANLPTVYLPSYSLVSAYLSTADLSTYLLLIMQYKSMYSQPVYCHLSSYSFVSVSWLTVYRQPVHLSYNQYAVFVLPPTCLPFFLFLCNCLPVYRWPVNICPLTTANLSTIYLSFCFFVSASCLPVFCRPVHLYSLTTADQSTIYLSSYSFASANLSTADLPTMSTDYLSTADLSTCTFLIFYICQPLNLLPVFLFLSVCQLPTCLPPICPAMFTEYFSTANCLPVYRRSAQQCSLNTSLLPICLPPTSPPMSTYMQCGLAH